MPRFKNRRGLQRTRNYTDYGFERELNGKPPRSPRRNANRFGRNSAAGKRGSAKARSRDFLEGQLFERDRMDGYREPRDDYTDEGRFYGQSNRHPRRIGYRE